MSASWSLTGGKRTSSGQPNLVEIDPRRTSLIASSTLTKKSGGRKIWLWGGLGFSRNEVPQMSYRRLFAMALFAVLSFASLATGPVFAQTPAARPNILVIFGDDIGQANISAYTHGLVGYETPNIDRISREGMTFTDYYAENSCTAGRSSFITGQTPKRTGLSKVGIPGAPDWTSSSRHHNSSGAQAAGLRDRPVRQEPSWRPQRISAHRAWLRRVLRQPLSPECRG